MYIFVYLIIFHQVPCTPSTADERKICVFNSSKSLHTKQQMPATHEKL